MSVQIKLVLSGQWFLSALLVFSSAAHANDEEKFELGKKVFTEQAMPSCAICHALQDAGATGAIGPDLDELKPTEERTSAAVKGGIGVMPAFPALSAEQVEAVAYYVSQAVSSK